MSLRKIDIDADGDYDVLASDRKGKKSGVLWLENPAISAPIQKTGKTAKESRQWTEHRIGAHGEEVMFLDAHQNAAAKTIEIIVSAKPRQVFHFRSEQSRPLVWQTRQTTIKDKVGRAKALHFADVDNDGRLDIVASSEGASEIGVFWFSATALALPEIRRIKNISGAEGTKFDRIETADLDGDGDLDVITCEEQDNLGVIWYENPTNENH